MPETCSDMKAFNADILLLISLYIFFEALSKANVNTAIKGMTVKVSNESFML
ncbi:hypothetical protein DSECCO2_555260 [anaerobic digester metagenome]